MRLEKSAGHTVIHNRRFARRPSAHSHFLSYPNPSTHRAAQAQAQYRPKVEPFSAGLPFTPAVDPLADSRFVAECAEGVLNGLPDAVIGVGRDGCIKTCNAAGVALIGAPPGSTLGPAHRRNLLRGKYLVVRSDRRGRHSRRTATVRQRRHRFIRQNLRYDGYDLPPGRPGRHCAHRHAGHP